jgi:hypothetical protein
MASRKIEDLHPLMQPIARKFLEQADSILGDKQAFITDGYRSFEEQTKLYAQGRTAPGSIVTNAKAGQSPHNFGLAIDVAFRGDGTTQAIYSLDLYKKLVPLATSLSLTWGGSWSGFHDNPHFEMNDWIKISKGYIPLPLPTKSVISETSDKGIDMQTAELLKKYGLKTVEELDAKIVENMGTTWGKEPSKDEENQGGFLGSARRDVTVLSKQLAAQKGLVTQANTTISGLQDQLAQKPVSKSMAMNGTDWQKWANDTLIFLGPAILTQAAALKDIIPTQAAWGVWALFALNTVTNWLRKFISGAPQSGK